MSLRPHLRRTEDKARNLLEQTTWTPAYLNVYDSVQSSRAATTVPPTAPASPKGRPQAAISVCSATSVPSAPFGFSFSRSLRASVVSDVNLRLGHGRTRIPTAPGKERR